MKTLGAPRQPRHTLKMRHAKKDIFFLLGFTFLSLLPHKWTYRNVTHHFKIGRLSSKDLMQWLHLSWKMQYAETLIFFNLHGFIFLVYVTSFVALEKYSAHSLKNTF